MRVSGLMCSKRSEDQRGRVVRVLSVAAFLIFFQANMIAPLIPRLSITFGVSEQTVGLMIPAYMIPYGIAALFYNLLSDHIGRRRIMLASLLAFVVLTALTATAQSASQMIFWRLLTGLGASGVVPLALALMGALFPYEERGRPLGWLFGSIAGGVAFGSTVGVVLEPFIGWRMLFIGVGGAAAGVVGLLLPYRSLLGGPAAGSLLSFRGLFVGYSSLLEKRRALRTYGYVLVNSIFATGVYTWLGVYFARRYGLGEVGIGLAILGYGVPGFLLGPIIGRAADRWGRRWLIPIGLGISAIGAAIVIFDVPLVVAALAVTILSLGYDMTQPLLAGIVTSLGGKRIGQAMGLNVFTIFIGSGIGSFLFGEALRLGFSPALTIFGAVELAAAIAAVPLFRFETAPVSKTVTTSQ
jgi:predicted MFS family arabinose efflux permease